MLMIQHFVFFLFKLMCLVRTNEITERNVCLTDLLKFYRTTGKSCAITEASFTRLFKDSQRTCLVKCTLKKLTPELQSGRWYELEKLEIHFLNTFFTFTMMKPCSRYENTNLEIAVECDERGFYDRKIGESCKEESHCNASNPYSTCNTRSGVCECKKGYFAMFNTCFQDHPPIGEICELNEPCMEIGVCRQTGKECSPLREIDNIHSSQHTVAKNRDPPVGMTVGAAAAGFVSGIIVCGIVCIMLSRCKKSTSAKRSVEFAATVDSYGFEVVGTSAEISEQKTVQVSEESSRSDVNQKGGTVPLDDIYNHLHESSGVSGFEPEYDHVPCNGTNDDTYHPLNLGNTKNVNTATQADLENHYN